MNQNTHAGDQHVKQSSIGLFADLGWHTMSAMVLPSWALEFQILNLRRTRDLLLPRLLSGQVSLSVKK
jgi:hypothetical protein